MTSEPPPTRLSLPLVRLGIGLWMTGSSFAGSSALNAIFFAASIPLGIAPAKWAALLVTVVSTSLASWAGAQAIPRLWPPCRSVATWKVATSSAAALLLGNLVAFALPRLGADTILDAGLLLGTTITLACAGTYWYLPHGIQLRWP